MNRRDAVQYISLLVGGTLIGSQYFLEGCKSKTGVSMTFTPEDVAYLDEVADTILPATKTPGAKAAHVGQFMAMMVNDCYEAPDQKILHEGLAKLDDESQKKNNKSFMESTPQQRHDLLVELDKKATDGGKSASDYYKKLSADDKHKMALKRDFDGEDPMADEVRKNPYLYFTMMKQLALLGYFTSEIGCKQARRYVETPGRYDGCVDYKKGDKAWA